MVRAETPLSTPCFMAAVAISPSQATASLTISFLPPGKWWLIEPLGEPLCLMTFSKDVPLTPPSLISSAALTTILERVSFVRGIGNLAILFMLNTMI